MAQPRHLTVNQRFLPFPSTSSLFTNPPLLTLFQAAGVGGRKKKKTIEPLIKEPSHEPLPLFAFSFSDSVKVKSSAVKVEI